jgi:hypothetical protein
VAYSMARSPKPMPLWWREVEAAAAVVMQVQVPARVALAVELRGEQGQPEMAVRVEALVRLLRVERVEQVQE